MAMRILSESARLIGAERMLDISGAHIDSSLYQGPATLEFARRLADGGARVRVPSTLNVAGVDENGWRGWEVPEEWASGALAQMKAYEQMGCRPTWTCAPYQTEPRPAPGEQVAWGESSATVFVNSVLGARTERYPDLLDICCAVTGRAPAAGLHLSSNRAGEVLVDLAALPAAVFGDPAFFPVLGHWTGLEAGGSVPVFHGLDITPSEDDLKALGAAMASSGAVAMFHWPDVTPEAATLADAFGGDATALEAALDRPVRPTAADLSGARDALGSPGAGAPGEIDMVVLGSPHFSLAEFGALAELARGKRRHPEVRLLVTTGRAVAQLARLNGTLAVARDFGAEITVDTCILTSPMLPDEIRTIMTNSAKYAYYAPGLLGRGVVFGGLPDCVESAVRGRVVRTGPAWV